MKITEITEGWGEHSNKSNHTMNKFKREETDEAFADAWSTVKKSAVGRGVGAVAGAAGRQVADVKNTAMAKLGFNKAKGAKEMQRVVGGVIANFNRYLGQTKGKPTVGALKQYLNALGIQNPVMEVAKGAMAGQARKGFDPSKRGAQQPKAQAPATQAPATGGRKDTDVLTRNDLFDIIGKNIQQAMASGTLPKELKKFLGQ